jgi:hypothetical protein
MSRGKKEGPTSESRSAAEEVRKAFSGLPLEQKLSTLVKIELDMLGDAVDSVVCAVSSSIDEVAKACDFSEERGPATPGTTGQASTV